MRLVIQGLAEAALLIVFPGLANLFFGVHHEGAPGYDGFSGWTTVTKQDYGIFCCIYGDDAAFCAETHQRFTPNLLSIYHYLTFGNIEEYLP